MSRVIAKMTMRAVNGKGKMAIRMRGRGYTTRVYFGAVVVCVMRDAVGCNSAAIDR